MTCLAPSAEKRIRCSAFAQYFGVNTSGVSVWGLGGGRKLISASGGMIFSYQTFLYFFCLIASSSHHLSPSNSRTADKKEARRAAWAESPF